VAVNLDTLIDSLKREVNAPGADLFPDATDDSWLGALTDAFWEVRLYGFLSGFEENSAARGGPASFGEGVITPTGVVDETYDDPFGFSTTQDLGRDLQQLIVLWAGWKIVLSRLGSLQTTFRVKAGPVEYETGSAATVLKSVLDYLKSGIDFVLANMGTSTQTVVFDAMVERSYSEAVGMTWWVGY
jgi:hypothetical protein